MICWGARFYIIGICHLLPVLSYRGFSRPMTLMYTWLWMRINVPLRSLAFQLFVRLAKFQVSVLCAVTRPICAI